MRQLAATGGNWRRLTSHATSRKMIHPDECVSLSVKDEPKTRSINRPLVAV